MNAVVCVDGRLAAAIPADDRAFCYGDGLFETVLVAAGRPLWWPAHLQRLCAGAARLGIVMPAEADWAQDLSTLLQAIDRLPARAVLRLVLSRGSSRRGYAVDPAAPPRRVASLSPAPDPAASAEHGLRLQVAALRLARQPALAGLKHLNRLEQVLARRACDADGYDEAVMLDGDGQVVSAIAGNLLWRDADGWHTPPVEHCGIAGCCRDWGLQSGLWDERPLAVDVLADCHGLAVCNSVRGILPVARLGERGFPVDGEVRRLQCRLAADAPVFHYPFLGSD